MTSWMRALAVAFAVAVATGALLGAAGSGGGGSGYRVRAIFDNASFVIPGEDVKVAGVKVGTIESLALTSQNKAAVVLRIDDAAFTPFRTDASCRIGLQSLIGEQFVECTPTQPRAAGMPVAAPLPAIAAGDGKGQHLLPVANTETPVGIDLIQNVMRMPERERFRLIISDLGAGLAGNGQELRAALRRANPALEQTDRVIAVLARQDRVLGQLVDESDRVLAPLAARRRQLGDFIAAGGRTAAAVAARGADLERNLQKLPPFLRRLRPAANDFAALADQMTPALQSLQSHAATINESVARLGPTARLATPALVSLGVAADRGVGTFPALEPAVRGVGSLAHPLEPLAHDLAALSSSFDRSGGVENVMRFIYDYTGAVNGEDALGHYVRGGLQVSVCSGRVSVPAPGCLAKFPATAEASTAVASSTPVSSKLLDFLLGKDTTP
jgi:phospholipid/cholesterol/gamma-HCH transport system substrate-binding protein